MSFVTALWETFVWLIEGPDAEHPDNSVSKTQTLPYPRCLHTQTLMPICMLSLCRSSAFLSLLYPPAVLACFICPWGWCSDVKTWTCATREAVSGSFFLRDPGPEERDVSGHLRHEAIGWWLRSQPGRREGSNR